MNQLNHGSLETCQRLLAAGIVLETDAIWEYDAPCSDPTDPARNQYGEWKLVHKPYKIGQMHNRQVPAPSMAEVWRELPWYMSNYGELEVTQIADTFACGFHKGLAIREPLFTSTNPADALIDLLIWVTEQGKEKVSG